MAKENLFDSLLVQKEEQSKNLGNPIPLEDNFSDEGFEDDKKKSPDKKSDSAEDVKKTDIEKKDGDQDSAEKKSPDKKDETDYKTLAETLKAENAKLKEDFEKAEKRVKDNQASYHSEHQARLDMEKNQTEISKRLQELEGKKDDLDAKALDAFEEGDKKAYKLLQDKINQLETAIKKYENLENSILNKIEQNRIATSTADFAKAHPDYYDVVKIFVPIKEKDPEGKGEWGRLESQWKEKGATPEAVYEMAKAYNEQQEYLKDPEGFKKRLLEEAKKSPAGDKRNDSAPSDADDNEIPDLNINSARGEHNEIPSKDSLLDFLDRKPKPK